MWALVLPCCARGTQQFARCSLWTASHMKHESRDLNLFHRSKSHISLPTHQTHTASDFLTASSAMVLGYISSSAHRRPSVSNLCRFAKSRWTNATSYASSRMHANALRVVTPALPICHLAINELPDLGSSEADYRPKYLPRQSPMYILNNINPITSPCWKPDPTANPKPEPGAQS